MIIILWRKITAVLLLIAILTVNLVSCTEDTVINNNSGDNTGQEISDITDTKETEQGGNAMTVTNKNLGIICPPDKPAYYNPLIDMLKNENGISISINEISWDNIKEALDINKNELVILPDAASIPYDFVESVDLYLKNGGKLITLGGPPLSKLVYLSSGEWKSREDLTGEASQNKNSGNHILFDFEKPSDGKNWSRATNDPGSGQTVEITEAAGPDGSNAFHVVLDNMTGWDNISKSIKIPEGMNSIGLYVKGGPMTTAMCLEIAEKDGSRWIASFSVSEEWQYVVLTAQDFDYWHDNPSTGRGGSGDNVILANAKTFNIGIALSHVTVPTGRHEYWLADICALNFENLAAPSLVIDGLSPEWKFYPVTNGKTVVTFDNQVIVSQREYNLPAEIFSLSPRPQGTGFGREREKRFIPLIEIYDEKNLRSGFLAWMFVNSSAKNGSRSYEGSIIAGFGTSDPDFYEANGLAAVLDVIHAMLENNFFVEAGAEEYIYVDSEAKTVTLGANILSVDSKKLTVEIDLYNNNKNISHKEYDISDMRGINNNNKSGTKIYSQSEKYDLSAGKPDFVTATLKKDGKIIDRISHEIVFWSPKPENERRYISAANNEFMRDGKPVRLYGVNYMPTSGIGVNPENYIYFEQYVSSESYDPDVFYKDLLRVKEVGFNAISLFVYYQTAMQTKNMLHLINMCDKLGLIVDISIRPHADPLDFDGGEVIDMIKALHIAELDNVVAYDIAWERTFGNYEGNYGNPAGRKAYDSEWERWVINNYGSIENAEKLWGDKIPRDGASVTSLPDSMLRSDGPHTKMTAAYRRFVDELISEKHNIVKDLILEHDPYHLVSARTGSAGGIPMIDPGSDMGYDFQALATAFDFMSPESYAFNSDISTAEQGIFTNTYARYTLPGSPVMWKEFGQHIWLGSNFADNEKTQEIQADYYKHIYEMMIAGHTGGAFCWWWPGGYRSNENSDYGVVNPDGSDRLSTEVIRSYRDAFLNQPALPESNEIFVIDRDKYASGIKDIYLEIKDDFFAAVNSGKTVEFRDKSTGTDIGNVPDISVGNAGEAGPENPARYINGIFRAVYIKLADGSWKKVNYGDKITIPKGSVEIKAIMCNSMGAEWLLKDNSGTGYVSLVSTDKSNISFNLPLSGNGIRSIKYLDIFTQEFILCDDFNDEINIAFRFGIEGRFPFGSTFMFIVAAQK